MGQKPKSKLKEKELSYCHHTIRLNKRALKRECQNRMKNDQVMPISRGCAKVAGGSFWPKDKLFWEHF